MMSKYMGAHSHTHINPLIFTTQEGIKVVKWTFFGLLATGLLQLIGVYFSKSAALLADTVHNFADATTSIPLWIAFTLMRLKPNRRFTYGYGRVEDVAGIFIVFMILFSAVMVGKESIDRLLHPRKVEYLWIVCIASIIGFLANEIVAQVRIKVGKKIGSAALVADGLHARADGLTSLAVLLGALCVWLGYPIVDSIVGLIITAIILKMAWNLVSSIFTRILDGVDPDIIDKIKSIVKNIAGVKDVSEVRVRWLGHQLHAEVNIAVNPELTVEKAHEIAKNALCNLLQNLPYLSDATIHIDPENASGERYHRFHEHTQCNFLHN